MLCILENVPCTLDKSVYYAFGRKNINIYILLLLYSCLCPTLCDPMDFSMPDFPVLHYLLESESEVSQSCPTLWDPME